LSLGDELRGVKLGLDRMRAVLDRLGNPERSFRSVHVAGTNGKGSTAAMIEAGLRAAGRRTGLYTSPHLVRINERIRTGGADIPDDAFAAAFEAVLGAVEQMLAEGQAHPTYFECVTALGFEHFRRSGVEFAVVEVGLGGRLDATNVLQPEVAVITPIDFDHESFLGKAAEAISAEKAGILKAGAAAVFAPQRPEARAVLEARAAGLGLRVVRVGEDWRAERITSDGGRYRFLARGIRAELALAGEHQVTNALAAIAALDLLGVGALAIEQGLRSARWPGRLETVSEAPLILLDGAHNPAGARALVRFLQHHHAGRRVWLIYGAMRDKAVEEVAGILFPAAHRVILTQVRQARAVTARALASIVSHHHPCVSVAVTLAEALDRARAEARGGDAIVITGSLFLVGEAKSLLP
jgi:dihydrofolate synthase/folylpolyglutamate synthase